MTAAGAQPSDGPSAGTPGDSLVDAGTDVSRLTAGLRSGMLIATLALMVGAAAVLSLVTHRLFEQQLAPEMTRQAATIARFLAADVERALGYGIPISEVVGVAEHFEKARSPHPEMEYIALHRADGTLLQAAGTAPHAGGEGGMTSGTVEAVRGLAAGRPALGSLGGDLVHTNSHDIVLHPVRHAGAVAGVVVVGIDASFVRVQMQELAYDVLTVLLVAVILAFEILALLTNRVVSPLRALHGLMLRVGQGQLDQRLPDRVPGVAGHLFRTVNGTLDALRKRYGRAAAALAAEANGPAPLRERMAEIGRRFGLGEAGADGAAAAPRPAQSVFDVRLPLFLFVFAEELQKSFLPLYIRELFQPVGWLSPAVLLGMPISVYMLALALITPVAGAWTDRFGTRGVFIAGLLPAIGGFVGSSIAGSLFELLGYRALTAIGYAMITIAAQGYIAAVTARQGRAQGMSAFVGVLMAASVCGTAIGGILADRLGYRPVFLFAAALAALAGFLAFRMLSGETVSGGAVRPGARSADYARLLGNRRFLTLLLLAAIPAKIVLTGFLFYAVPLYLAEFGASEAETGRVMILYSILIIAVGPWAGRYADRSGRSWHLVFAGTLLSGVAMAVPGFLHGLHGVLLAVTLLALGHAVSISPQIALVPEVCRAEIDRVGQTTVLSILRMLERVGSVAGPLLVAGVIARLGYVDGLTMIGATVAALSLPLLFMLRSTFRPVHPKTEMPR
ncbi:MFS transporter [Azospirillum sp. SYSU D00513]|uniref:MFS transporter n=1 Tax=Azospirillum sp. SYSU D00513 TaxID=2812561 RepID=UPI001A97C9E6|nr:MFS transporter [Azospirillum sp. SYSU D00513]